MDIQQTIRHIEKLLEEANSSLENAKRVSTSYEGEQPTEEAQKSKETIKDIQRLRGELEELKSQYRSRHQ